MDDIARLFKALSDETRLRIVAMLIDGERCVCDLMTVLGLPQSTVSRHLAYLRNSGWVVGHRNGMWMHYRLADNLSPLQNDVLTALRMRLLDTDQVMQDFEALQAFLKTKTRKCDDERS